MLLASFCSLPCMCAWCACVIGGGVSKAGTVLFDYIRPAFEKYAFHGCRGAEFALATLGNDAGIYGAAGLILNE